MQSVSCLFVVYSRKSSFAMGRLIPDVIEGIMEIGPAPGDWKEYKDGSILKTTKVYLDGYDPRVSRYG